MRFYLELLSSAVSGVVAVLFFVAVYGTLFLETRARWSGETAPEAWIKRASTGDVFSVAGLGISYWGDPNARYSKYATRSRRKPVAVVVHYTAAKPVKNLVRYGHMSDPNRGGASFGYHFYIGRDGHIVQGAPLSRRTNHIKFKTNKQRRRLGRHLWSGNTIALTLVGGCDPVMRPRWGRWYECSGEFITKVQLQAGLKVVRALQEKFGIACEQVYGHGELQFDRKSFEGLRLSKLAREGCDALPEVIVPPKPVEAEAPKETAAKASVATGG